MDDKVCEERLITATKGKYQEIAEKEKNESKNEIGDERNVAKIQIENEEMDEQRNEEEWDMRSDNTELDKNEGDSTQHLWKELEEKEEMGPGMRNNEERKQLKKRMNYHNECRMTIEGVPKEKRKTDFKSSDRVPLQSIVIEHYEVESIAGVKKVLGKVYYLANWKPSWIREDQLVGCETLIKIFQDSQDNEVCGYAVQKEGLPNDTTSSKTPTSKLLPKKTSGSYKENGEPCSKKKTSGSYKENAEPYSKKKATGSYKNGDEARGYLNDVSNTDHNHLRGACGDVAAVLGIFYGKDNITYYRVKWESTWEEECKLSGCWELIRRFFQQELNVIVSKPEELGVDEIITVKEESV